MAWEIEKITNTVKKNPSFFLLGGGVVAIVALLLARNKTDVTVAKGPERVVLPEQPTGGSAGGSDFGQFATDLLFGFSEISAQQQEQFQAGLESVQMGQVALFGSMQDSIISLQKEQTSLFSGLQSSFENTLDKLITSQQKNLAELMENQYYPASSGGGKSASSTKSSSSSKSSSTKSTSKDVGDNSAGYAYIDKYGFSHVVSSRETAEQYAAPGTEITSYQGSYSGGYARDEDGERVSLGGVPYGN